MNNLCNNCPGHPNECHAKITEVTFYSDVRPGTRGTAADAVVDCAENMRLRTAAEAILRKLDNERGAA